MAGPTYVRVSADTNDLTAKLAVAKADFSAFSSELRKAATEMRNAGAGASAEMAEKLRTAATAASSARVQVAALNRELNAGAPKGFMADVTSLLGPLRSLAGGFTAVSVAMGAWNLVKNIGDIADQAEVLGFSTDALQAYRAGATEAGADTAFVDNVLQKFTRSVGENKKEFTELGLTQNDLAGGPEAALQKTMVALLAITDVTKRAAIETAIFTRGGQKLEQVLEQWASPDLIKRMRELGYITSPENVKKADDFGDGMGRVFAKIKVMIGDAILDWRTYANVAGTLDLAIKGAPAPPGGPPPAVGTNTIPDILPPEVQNFKFDIADYAALSDLQKLAGDTYASWQEDLVTTQRALGLFGDQAKAYEVEYWAHKLQTAQVGGDGYIGIARQINSTILSLESGRARDEEQIATAATAKAARDAEDVKKRFFDNVNEQMKAANAAAEMAANINDKEYDRFLFNLEMKKEAAGDNLAEQLLLDDQWVQAAATAYGKDTDAWRAAIREKTRDVNLAVQQIAQPWKQLTAGISGSFRGMFQDIIGGTTTFGQIMVNFGNRLVGSFADAGLRIAQQWVQDQLLQVAATQVKETALTGAVAAGEASRVAIKTAAAGEGAVVEAAAGSASIFKNANKAAAGAFAAVAEIPYIGPVLAPIAAATAFVAVMAFDIFSARGGMDIGAGVSPIVQLHENEMVIPANLAQGIREMTAGGGAGSRGRGALIGNVTTMDPRSFQNFINNPTNLRSLKKRLDTYGIT